MSGLDGPVGFCIWCCLNGRHDDGCDADAIPNEPVACGHCGARTEPACTCPPDDPDVVLCALVGP